MGFRRQILSKFRFQGQNCPNFCYKVKILVFESISWISNDKLCQNFGFKVKICHKFGFWGQLFVFLRSTFWFSDQLFAFFKDKFRQNLGFKVKICQNFGFPRTNCVKNLVKRSKFVKIWVLKGKILVFE